MPQVFGTVTVSFCRSATSEYGAGRSCHAGVDIGRHPPGPGAARTTGARNRPRLRNTDRVTSVAFSPDGTGLATGSWDHTIWLWKARSTDPTGGV
ncbi:WD40 repeat domain-containing protein [Nocardia sp. NPDC052254]|uniref:WD40 repeat domain-containing protein n=1 Tax=Nocardia sp. NPDC052254 TaxID=3155681 RepID=UPI00344971EF